VSSGALIAAVFACSSDDSGPPVGPWIMGSAGAAMQPTGSAGAAGSSMGGASAGGSGGNQNVS